MTTESESAAGDRPLWIKASDAAQAQWNFATKKVSPSKQQRLKIHNVDGPVFIAIDRRQSSGYDLNGSNILVFFLLV